MATERIIILAIVIASLISVASAVAGTATYYTEYLPSACYGNQGQGTMIAAANRGLYSNGAACGKYYKVRCTGPTNEGVPQPCRNGEITVKIVDLCPGCGTNQLDLSQQAFSKIANPDAGRIHIEYNP
ncbi:EG45-like domain containing protein [Henckelia pumila]|uniref:EG45-like domain containing protein n=1 Tax=Henckelia pumila TaxID=405737 RepID=UPI003C6E7F08